MGARTGRRWPWINEAFRVGAKFDDVASSGEARFATLDIVLHMAVTAIIKGGNRTLATKLASLPEEHQRKFSVAQRSVESLSRQSSSGASTPGRNHAMQLLLHNLRT